jgi:cellulose synthase/poly-beta-1,6-N-acetylglucosamine synthase-like glycosyltransferase
LDYPTDRLLILVLNDGSHDRTAAIASEVAASSHGPKIEVLDFDENRGKCATLFRGVDWLRRNRPDVGILAFTDANAMWMPDALKKIVAPFADPKVGSVSGLLRYSNPDGTPSGDMEGLYWRYEAAIKRMSSRLGSLPGANGSIFALRLDVYDPISETRGDDLELPVQAVIKGYRSILVGDAVSIEPPSPDFLTEYRRKLRITATMIPSAGLLFRRSLAKGRGLIAFQLFSHKLLRYLVPFLQIALLLSAGLLWNYSLFYRIAFGLQVFFYLLAAIGFALERLGSRPPKPLQVPLYFTMVNLASLVGLFRAAAGQPVVWERNR